MVRTGCARMHLKIAIFLPRKPGRSTIMARLYSATKVYDGFSYSKNGGDYHQLFDGGKTRRPGASPRHIARGSTPFASHVCRSAEGGRTGLCLRPHERRRPHRDAEWQPGAASTIR